MEEEDDEEDTIDDVMTAAGDQLVRHLPALKHLTLEVPSTEPEADVSDTDEVDVVANLVRKDAQDIQRAYPINALLRCKSLKTFTLCSVSGATLTEDFGFDEVEFWEPLITWLREQLAEKAPKVTFRAEYTGEKSLRPYVGFADSARFEEDRA